MTETELGDLVRRRMRELNLSYRKAAEKSGGMVSRATLNNIATGKHTFRLDGQTITGMSLALEVTEEEIRRVAGIPEAEPVPEFSLPPRAGRLSPRGRRALISMLDALLEAEANADLREGEIGDEPPRRRAEDRDDE